jgi:hypothetical protein
VRIFVRTRELTPTHSDLAKWLAELEEKTEALAVNHDTFNCNTHNQLKQVFDALRELITPPDPPKRPIGFINPEGKGKKALGEEHRVASSIPSGTSITPYGLTTATVNRTGRPKLCRAPTLSSLS